jgi:hypothetical protein
MIPGYKQKPYQKSLFARSAGGGQISALSPRVRPRHTWVCLRVATHEEESIRLGIPHSGDPWSRLDIDRNSTFSDRLQRRRNLLNTISAYLSRRCQRISNSR